MSTPSTPPTRSVKKRSADADEAERERGYEERYAREIEGDIAPERTERAEESDADR